MAHPAYNSLSVEEALDLELLQELLASAEAALMQPEPPLEIIAETFDHLVSNTAWLVRSSAGTGEDDETGAFVDTGSPFNLQDADQNPEMQAALAQVLRAGPRLGPTIARYRR